MPETSTPQQPETMGVIYRMPTSELHPHPDNPFGVRDDPEMQELVDSVQKFGVLVPAIARPRPDGGFELISGHRRKHASELAGLDFMPVIVLNLNDDEAISNQCRRPGPQRYQADGKIHRKSHGKIRKGYGQNDPAFHQDGGTDSPHHRENHPGHGTGGTKIRPDRCKSLLPGGAGGKGRSQKKRRSRESHGQSHCLRS